MPKSRLLLFKSLAIVSPVLFLALLECGLRLFGYGHNLDLFIKDSNRKGYLVMNQYVSEKYFSSQKNATTGNFEPFTEKKKAGTFRIFVLGESTTIGYPYMNNGSFHRWLQYRLMHTFPDKDFEIINLSLTAVNSHTVLDFARNVIDYEPDAIMVYTGHNEYYGALGAASTGTFGRNKLVIKSLLKLREFRLVQLLSAGISAVSDLFSGNKIDLRENLMKRMAADQQIQYGSAVYQAGIDQFESNMNELGELMSAHHIPLLLSNLVSNEKDLKPLVSMSGGAEVSADFHFRAGNDLLKKGQFVAAKNAFVKAKELDVLRFRAPEEMNLILKNIATKYPGVTLVDTKSLFEKHSEHQILGSETLLEHVHPNLNGYALLSESFYEGLEKAKLLPATANRITLAELKKRMPITTVDSLKGAYEIMILKEGWPFNVPMPAEEKRDKTVEEQLAGALVVKQLTWQNAMASLQNHYAERGDTANVLKVVEALVLENPLQLALYDQAGKLSLAHHDDEKAIVYWSRAFRIEPNFERSRQLFITLLKLDKPQQALPYIQYAAANNTSRFNLSELQSFVQQLLTFKSDFEKDTSNVTLTNRLAASYLQFANAAAAGKYVNMSLKLEPGNVTALKMQHQIRLISK
jgi:tetratricopeptide (TPR) repeat protein